MSIDVMVVGPCAGIEKVTREEFLDWLDSAVEDFSIRYCSLAPTQENIDTLSAFAIAGEASAQMILEAMGIDASDIGDTIDEDDADGVELFIG